MEGEDFFSTKKYYQIQGNQSSNNIWAAYWKFKALFSVLIFLWRIENKIIPKTELLKNRFEENFNFGIYAWCGVHFESISHLFLKCDLAVWGWELVES